jgi:hypothetical protein
MPSGSNETEHVHGLEEVAGVRLDRPRPAKVDRDLAKPLRPALLGKLPEPLS